MYNKIFTKILDSSIWLEPDATRIVWLTCIAAMDEDGFCQFASVANLAHRANVSLESATRAVETLEQPDANSSDPEFEGRRIERVPGGWMVLNAAKYRDLVTRTISRERTRVRVSRYRARMKSSLSNGPVTPDNDSVTQSEAYSGSGSETKEQAAPECESLSPEEFVSSWNAITTPPIPRCRELTDDRKRRIRSRIRAHPDLSFWRDVFARVEASAFCRGDSDRGWTASIDWILSNDTNAVKVLEGRYDTRPQTSRASPPTKADKLTAMLARVAALDSTGKQGV